MTATVCFSSLEGILKGGDKAAYQLPQSLGWIDPDRIGRLTLITSC